MDQKQLPYFIILTILILIVPFFSTDMLMILDHILIRVGLILVLLYLSRVGPTVALLGLVAISMLFLERNRRKVGQAIQKIDLLDINYKPQATVEEEGQPQKTVPVLPFDTPVPDVTDYLPQDKMEDDAFEPVAPSINEKAVLSTIYPLRAADNGSASASDILYEQLGFGHVHGVETMGESQ